MKKLLQKNRQIIVCLSLLFLALTPMQMMAQKRVLFICNSAFNPAPGPPAASTSQTDPLIKLLQADPTHFTVTTISTTDGTVSVQKNGVNDITALEVSPGVAANSSPANIAAFYANYDLLITQESFTGTSNIWKPTIGLLGINNITIPVIYTKLFALQTGRALTDLNGTPTGNITATIPTGNKLTVTVDPVNQTNPLFTGVTFVGNDVQLFNAGASDAGSSTTGAVKAIDMGFNINVSTSPTGDIASQLNTQLAYITTANTPTDPLVTTNPVTPVAGVNPNSTMLINDIPGGTYFGTAGHMLPITSHMILLSFNYGATAMGYATGVTSNVTDDGLRIFKNAALILTDQSLGVNTNTLASESISVSPNPTSGIVTVNSASDVKLITAFDAAGKQVLSASNTASINLSNQTKGVYFVKIETENGSTTKKVVVE